MAPLRWMAQNHVAANLLMLVFIIGGLIMSLDIKQEIFPEVSLDMIQVQVAYPGAGPEEVEEGIILAIEDELTGVNGIKELTATASEGAGVVLAEVRSGANADVVLQDVQSAVDRIVTFPEEAEEPVVSKLLNRREVVSVVISGDLSEHTLREQAELIRDEILEQDNITQVSLGGVRPYEIHIELDETTLQRYGLTLSQVAQRVRQASRDLPGGSIETRAKEILLRTIERREHGLGYANIRILSQPDGSEIRLGDIATIRDSFRETDTAAQFDGKPAAMIKVYRVGDQKPTGISRTVEQYIDAKQAQLPKSIHLSTWNDSSEMLASRMQLLIKNAVLGLGLVLVVLGLFLEVRLALWVMLGIPISFLGALFIAPALNVSINMVSLFAFIMALGVVVDDAIVVGENIFEQRRRQSSRLEAAVAGARQVAMPVTFAIMTSVCAFIPLLVVKGMMGKFIKVIPQVVIIILLVSLIESLFVLPAHLALGQPKERPPRGLLGYIERGRLRFSRFLQWVIDGPYHYFLEAALRWRYVTLAVALSVLLLTLGVIGGGYLKFTFMPKVDSDEITVDLEMPQGTPVERTQQVARHITQAGMDLVREYDADRPQQPDSVMRHIYTVTGGTIAGSGPTGGSSASGANLANIAMLLKPSEKRDFSSTAFSEQWQDRVGEIPGVESLSFKSDLVHMGEDINIQLAHKSIHKLEQASARIQQILHRYQGVSNIADNYAQGKPELKLTLKPAARTLGLTETDLATQVRNAYYGAEALRFQRQRNEIKVMVRYPRRQREHLYSLEQLRLRTPDGGEIPLHQAAHIEEGLGYSQINRSERKRVMNVTAKVDDRVTNAQEILGDLEDTALPQLLTDYRGLSYSLEGEEAERQESMQSMRQGFLLALFGIYALLAVPFRSYSQPLLIMAAIPFGMVGAALGHLLLGYDLTILSMFGLVALAGVVVNDSLLLIDRCNQNRRGGMSLHEAVLAAGRRRFRPIWLTSLTTFFGLFPMILETSMQAKFLIPMAISLGFGILFATGITLLLIPTFYLVLEDIRNLFALPSNHAVHHEDVHDSR